MDKKYMFVKILPVGQLGTNCYVVSDENTHDCVIIDPGAESNTILGYVAVNGLTVRAVFLTHAHFDHVMALGEVIEKTGVPFYVNENEFGFGTSREEARVKAVPGLRSYTEGDVIEIGPMKFEVLLTPGHTMGSVVLKCGDSLFTGDTLFAGSCGRTDLGGSMDMMEESLRRLSKIDGDFNVYPGHAESSTLERERKTNYYMRYANESFPNQ